MQDRFQISLKRMCATGDRESKELPGCARFELGGVFQGHAASHNDVVTGVVVHQLLVLARPAHHTVMYHWILFCKLDKRASFRSWRHARSCASCLSLCAVQGQDEH